MANPASVVRTGSTRFTVLTENLIRMEYDPNQKFEDRATASILNRFLPKPDFSFTNSSGDGSVTITTPSLVLTYTGNNRAFAPNSLSIAGNVDGFHFNYVASGSVTQDNSLSRNLLGTIRTLDGINAPFSLNCTQGKARESGMHCTWAVIGRDGYALIGDEHTATLDNNWLSHIGNQDMEDWYFFGHGLNFKLALKEFALISGAHPLAPRYSLGSWHSRWFDYSDLSIKQVVNMYENHMIPLDVVVLDMNWHIYGPWGCYTWHEELFPYPSLTQEWFRTRGLRSTANVHDDNGIAPIEMYYAAAASDLGVTNGKTIPFNVTDEAYMMALMDDIQQPITQTETEGAFGFDFWWIDWQQGETTGVYYSTINPTLWLNYVRHTNHIRRDENIRGQILARYGGYGSQRYPVGFSGDCTHTWQFLAWLPYFTATAANVGFEWSHDIVGETNQDELNTRWIQFGAYSPVFRIHDRGMATGGCANTQAGCVVIEIFEHPFQNMVAERRALQHRAELLPYLYNATNLLYSDGIQLTTPMYYEYAGVDAAYDAGYEYMFGPHLIVSPIATSAGSDWKFNLTTQSVWIPPTFTWYELHSGLYYTASDHSKGLQLTRAFILDEYPIYVRTPSIIAVEPMDSNAGAHVRVLGRANTRFYRHLRWDIFGDGGGGSSGGSFAGSTVLYEDDGYTYDYVRLNRSVVTSFKYNLDPRTFAFTATVVSVGAYDGFDTSAQARNYSVRVANVLPPNSGSVRCGATAMAYNRMSYDVGGTQQGWYYDGQEMAVTVNCPRVNPLEVLSVTMQFGGDWQKDMMVVAGMKGKVRRAVKCKQSLDEANVNYGADRANLTVAASYSTMLGYIGDNRSEVSARVNDFEAVYQAAVLEVKALPVNAVGLSRLNYCIALLDSINM